MRPISYGQFDRPYAAARHSLPGPGLGANSMICYVLGITSIDPVKHELAVRTLHLRERKEPPDIDVDFEHERREEVIQWIYEPTVTSMRR
jgi:DNA polymerase III alpha subunit